MYGLRDTGGQSQRLSQGFFLFWEICQPMYRWNRNLMLIKVSLGTLI